MAQYCLNQILILGVSGWVNAGGAAAHQLTRSLYHIYIYIRLFLAFFKPLVFYIDIAGDLPRVWVLGSSSSYWFVLAAVPHWLALLAVLVSPCPLLWCGLTGLVYCSCLSDLSSIQLMSFSNSKFLRRLFFTSTRTAIFTPNQYNLSSPLSTIFHSTPAGLLTTVY